MTYLEPVDAQILKKIGVNVAVLIGVSFLLIAIVAVLAVALLGPKRT